MMMTVQTLFQPTGTNGLGLIRKICFILAYLPLMSIPFFRKSTPRHISGPSEANPTGLLTDRQWRTCSSAGGQIKNLFSIRRIGSKAVKKTAS